MFVYFITDIFNWKNGFGFPSSCQGGMGIFQGVLAEGSCFPWLSVFFRGAVIDWWLN